MTLIGRALSAASDALRRVMRIFERLETNLDRAQALASIDALRQNADIVNTEIYRLLPVLGFILRSTNVRNSFELVEPLQVIAEQTVQGIPKLLLSAEWDYVPFLYPQDISELQNFVLIGMPGSEVNNSLISPLAGHELGHTVWRNRRFGDAVNTTLQLHCEQGYIDRISDFRKVVPEYKPNDLYRKELLPESQEISINYANRQAEELFCDMFAYAIFGESYLQAFAYILAPGEGRGPTGNYPTYKTRVQTLREIAAAEGMQLPDLAALHLADERHPGTAREKFIISIAEASVNPIKTALWSLAKEIVGSNGIIRPDKIRVNACLKQIRMGVPVHDPVCLGDIINAGWVEYRRLQETPGSPTLGRDVDNLNEIIMKSIEVLEFNRRISGGPKR